MLVPIKVALILHKYYIRLRTRHTGRLLDKPIQMTTRRSEPNLTDQIIVDLMEFIALELVTRNVYGATRLGNLNRNTRNE